MTENEIKVQFSQLMGKPHLLKRGEMHKFWNRLDGMFGRCVDYREAKIWEYRMFGKDKDCHE